MGFRLGLSAWQVDLLASGGLLRQDPADRTNPIGRGMLRVRRPIGLSGSFDFLVSGQGGAHFVAATGSAALSWQMSGGGR